MRSSSEADAPVRVDPANFENAAHCAAVLEILDSYASDPVGGGAPLTDDVRSQLVPLLRDHPSTTVFLASVAGRYVGVAVCFLNLSTFRARPVVNVGDLAVLPSHRGSGVGRALLTSVQDHARRLDCCRLSLEVQLDNRPALALYRSFGFRDLVYGDSEPTAYLVKPLGA